MLDLRNLETFVWVVKLGGFRRAAQKLNTTQPAISARIAALEQDLGVRLLDRQPRRVTLTVKGAELLGLAERMLSLRSEIRGAVANPASLDGVLRLGVPETIVHTWLAALVERISGDNPSLTVDIEVDSSVHLARALMEDRLDIAFLHSPDAGPGMIGRPLCAFPLGWFAAPALDVEDDGTSLAGLSRKPIITFRRESAPYMAVRQLLQREGFPGARMFGSSCIAAIVRMALDRIGTCVLPEAAVKAELRAGTLRRMPFRHGLPPLEFQASYSAQRNLHLAAVIADLAAATARDHMASPSLDQKILSDTSKSKIRPRAAEAAI